MKAGVLCMHELKPPEKFLGMLAQFKKLFPHRFKPVTDRLNPVDRIAGKGEPFSGRRPVMTDDEVELRRVDQDLLFCGLHGQDVGHMLVRNGITETVVRSYPWFPPGRAGK